MWKQYRSVILAGLLLSVISLVGYGVYRLPSLLLADAFDITPDLAESISPTGLGTVSFLRESATTDSSVYFYVRDPARSSKPLFAGEDPLGYATDGSTEMQGAIWSKDGSVVAVRAKVGDTSGHQYGPFFVDAYDFQSHRKVGTHLPTRQKSRVIKGLIHSRGGEGQIASRQPYNEGRSISRDQADEFKR